MFSANKSVWNRLAAVAAFLEGNRSWPEVSTSDVLEDLRHESPEHVTPTYAHEVSKEPVDVLRAGVLQNEPGADLEIVRGGNPTLIKLKLTD